jgi:hypothetical protein
MAHSRRSFIKIVAGAGIAVGAGVFLPKFLRQRADGQSPSVHALFGDLRAGSTIDRWTLVQIADVHAGCIPVLMATADGSRFQVDIAERDPEGPKGVAETEKLALYLVNGGGGNASTIEEHGLGVMALAAELRKHEQGVMLKLVKLRDRKKRFPDTPFKVFG